MKISSTLLAVPACLLLAQCAAPGAADLDRDFGAMMSASFRDQGIAQVTRLKQDEADAICSRAAGAKLPEDVARQIKQANFRTIKPPADGKYLGNWKAGEMLAQNGRGMTWTDKSTDPLSNGGSCYNCHQLSGREIAYGTIGPSLYKYAALHGVEDPSAPSAQSALEYAWGRLYNSRASNACSNMPRFGHEGLLSELQLKDLMALLFDPASPVNQ
jgi:L-cysteine S-thiosulfotransferase